MFHTIFTFCSIFAPAWAVRSQPDMFNAQYNQTEASLYLHYARASFCEECALTRWDCGESCEEAPTVPGTLRNLGPGAKSHVRGYIAEVPKTPNGKTSCIVAFKGSTHFKNWIADAKFYKADWPSDSTCPGCQVHHGFAQAYDELEEELVNAIEDLKCERFAVTGHSLGAAIATLTAFKIRTTLNKVADPVYLFGAPRVGNSAFAKRFVATAGSTVPAAWRVIHHHDPVPRSPPGALDYEHFPQEVYYNENEDNFRVCSSTNGEDPACAGQVSIAQAAFYTNQHMKYLNYTTKGIEMSHECIVRSGDDCAHQAGTLRCECEVIFYMGTYTSFSNPKRKAWETQKLSRKNSEGCKDELYDKLSMQEKVGAKDSKCTLKEASLSCECDVIFLMGQYTDFSNPKRKKWDTNGNNEQACKVELPGKLSFQEKFGVKDSRCTVKGGFK